LLLGRNFGQLSCQLRAQLFDHSHFMCDIGSTLKVEAQRLPTIALSSYRNSVVSFHGQITQFSELGAVSLQRARLARV
jgi:hypothetical protein